jgi:membrane protein DedA with SNARE-associated domain
MAQLSDALLQVAVLAYLAAMMGYLVEFAFGRRARWPGSRPPDRW